MAKKNKVLIYGLISLVILIAVGISFYAVNKETSGMEEVTVMMPFMPVPPDAPYYVALDKGYYAEEGLIFDRFTYTMEGSFGVIKQVAAGRAPIGIAAGDAVILARSKDIPVVAVYQVGHENPFGLIVKEDSGIMSPKDLDGKIIAITGPGSPTEIVAKTALKNSGVDYNNVTFIPVGGALVSCLTEDKVDATSAYIMQEVLLNNMGIGTRMFQGKDYGANLVTYTIITNEETLKNNPELVRKFVRATNRGLRYAVGHLEETTDIFLKYVPETDRKIALKVCERYVKEDMCADKYPVGQFNKEQWEMTQDILFDVGLIDKKTDVSKMYTDEFVPK